MAVNTEHGPADVGRVADNVTNQIGEFFRYGIADRVGEVDGGGTGGNCGLENATQVITVTAGAVFCRKFDVVRERLRIFDRINGPLDDCITTEVTVVITPTGYGSTVTLSDGPYEVSEEALLDEYARAIEIWAAALTQLRTSVDYSVDLRKER